MSLCFVRDFSDLTEHISNDPFGMFMDANDSIFDRLLIQPLVRNVNGSELKFIGIKIIELKSSCQGLGLFIHFLGELELVNLPIMFHDIINDRLYASLKQRGYVSFIEYKYNTKIKCLYKL